MKRVILALAILAAYTTIVQAQYPARCSGPCGRYYSYARGAGAAGTLGPLMAMQRQCQACIKSRRTIRRKQRRRCKRGFVPRGKYCFPKGASQCPKQRAKHCAAPNICATDLTGADSCFTKSALVELKAEKIRRAQEIRAAKAKALFDKRISSRAARDSELAQSFKQRHGMDYALWLVKLRQLLAILQSIPADQTEKRQQAQADIQATLAPPASEELPPPTEPNFVRLNSGKKSKRCNRNFDLSELWDESFKMVGCTKTAWVIAKRSKTNTTFAQCIALHPDGTLVIALKQLQSQADESAPPHFTTQLSVRELKTKSWLLGEGDKAPLRILVDDKELLSGTEIIEVSTKPPLRYSFKTKSQSIDLAAFAAGNKATAVIADRQWSMSLRGSSRAIKVMKFCAYGASVGRPAKR